MYAPINRRGNHMLFVTFFETLPGKNAKAIKLLKNPVTPEGVKIIRSLGMFGQPDAMIIFETDCEKSASDFVVQFTEVANIKTSLAFPMESMRWTQ